ncbi:thiamine pyrophosphate-dependent dehydrogenase E1 component subunit alpha [Bradymonadaceae bacterium TMQ3]|uniref:Thiamine pyrophosphate-dependent dehydrogenase E1 component subunit alpha n=1 Tax=Lujinxingia sediminis TaxID=2480984 RepID=A0ABY0CP06_9DELT|nr:thiamine pyrophosphate-dependent dehydrogenase E1 component subunit alpha [Lujinxingia sediminis]RDV36840.1 thiamine pyrophosphate-dependent dehydrogenase E1 component subunit alpha [Bradymonadaceae bacterium TMQ3]RVU42179.1 thiamine pyrophosphate-dependent dehydrogenase E1 component subunit alpha [Lujinxingia sediminis]TXC69463.1 thiamine pyrophosphate-dependent dehydrogenase E1 component subunit alpha [Bradymonadales bacterium TMQ1]
MVARERTGQSDYQEERIDPRARFAQMEGPLSEKLYAQMRLIRRFEEQLLERFDRGLLVGTTHAYIGQEADAVGVINHLRAGDVVFSNHRCHGHYLVWGDKPEALAAELMGRAGGLVGGRGGSQHICDGGFYTNGIQGGIVPGALGLSLAKRVRGEDAVAVVFIGDGTLGQGVLYECLNMASLWGAPLLVVLEDNGWAQSTPSHREVAGSMLERARAFGMEAGAIESTDAEAIYTHFEGIIEEVRQSVRPRLEVIHTYRLCHHSRSDDHRPAEEIEARRADDPLPKQRQRVSEERARAIEEAVEARLFEAFEAAEAQAQPAVEQLDDPLLRGMPGPQT